MPPYYRKVRIAKLSREAELRRTDLHGMQIDAARAIFLRVRSPIARMMKFAKTHNAIL